MSSFYCDICGALCKDSPVGYTTGCEHYPPDINKAGFPVKNKSYHRRNYRKMKKDKKDDNI